MVGEIGERDFARMLSVAEGAERGCTVFADGRDRKRAV